MKKLFNLFFALSLTATGLANASDNQLIAEMHTSKGAIMIELFKDDAPHTVDNFVKLSEEGFYDNLTFHRVIKNFMIQGGDPLGTGRGGPGYKFDDEFSAHLTHSTPGVLSIAYSGPNTNASQFFITHRATPWLDGKHSVFGRVINGMKVVNSIEKGDSIFTISLHPIVK
jgi:cyclophilin family peptidyl-prolyl cis-trans isomerase